MTILLLLGTITFIILLTAVWKIHPLPVLFLGAFLFGAFSGFGVQETLLLLSAGFGNTIRGIGLIIILGTIIGAFMEQRGALRVIAEKIIGTLGRKRAPFSMSLVGFIISTCIFCDSAFIILIGIWQKIGKIAKLPLAVGTVALSLGLLSSHCFVPPMPGPVAAITVLGADFGKVLLFGLPAAFVAAMAGYFYASLAGKNEILEIREAEIPEESAEKTVFKHHWPVAFLPILVPLFLIGSVSIAGMFKENLPTGIYDILKISGNPVSALFIGAVIAIFVIGKCHQKELATEGLIGKAVLNAANILMITGAGGAFGEVLKQIDFKYLLHENITLTGVLALLIPLSFSAILKIAQGSSTLAILTSASAVFPLLEPLGLTSPTMRALTCCAICCGSMIVSHTNDSYFWVVTKFSGMSVRQGLKLQTIGSLVSGISAAAVILTLAFIFGE
ncbi:MAG: GntP family permease [Lentisphaerae bacterium]|nr:GntP family permease [Lentisphaerota bacterium]